MKELNRINREETKKLKTRFKNDLTIVSWKNTYMFLKDSKMLQKGKIQKDKLSVKPYTIETLKERFNNYWLGLCFGGMDNKHLTDNIKMELKGRIKGVAKKKKLNGIVGSIKSQSIDKHVELTKKEIYTKWGILGLRVIKRD